MKSVVVCATQSPFVSGGAEILVRELASNLARRGFRTDVVCVPFHGHPPSEVVRQALAWRLLELRETTGAPIDLVIPTKFPSYLVRHARKVVWLFHQHREAYDLFGTELGSLTDGEEDGRVREAIRAMDATALSECREIFTISRNVARRLGRYNALAGTPLYPPPQALGRYRTEAYGDYLFYAGRLETVKRVDLAVRALAASRSAARLKIAGAGPLENDLRLLARRLGVSPRVDFLGYVPPEELVALYAGCRAAFYTPLDEDYGYVTVESFLSRKPVVTSVDAGGPLEFVEDGVNGFVVPPEAGPLGEAVDRLWALSGEPPARDGRGRPRPGPPHHVGRRRRPAHGVDPVRLALWTPRPSEGWVAALAPLLAREVTLELLDREPPLMPGADLDVYHLADDPAHGFAYRPLLRRPGLVVLEEWNLHRLVHAETAGRGDAGAYRREARRAHGDAGEPSRARCCAGSADGCPRYSP